MYDIFKDLEEELNLAGFPDIKSTYKKLVAFLYISNKEVGK